MEGPRYMGLFQLLNYFVYQTTPYELKDGVATFKEND